MKDVNKLILVGRLGVDPVQRETKTGKTVVNFSLATSRNVRKDGDLDGEKSVQKTEWHRVVAWGKQAEKCAKYLKKGQMAYVEGSIRSHQYNDKAGEVRYSVEVHADNVLFFNRPSAQPVELQAREA